MNYYVVIKKEEIGKVRDVVKVKISSIQAVQNNNGLVTIVYDQSQLVFGLINESSRDGLNGYIWNFRQIV